MEAQNTAKLAQSSNLTTQKPRNPWVDILRFIFALAIVFFHNRGNIGQMFIQGDLAITFFFMLTGFYALRSIQKQDSPGLSYSQGCASFIKRKILSVQPELFLTTIVYVAATYFLFHETIAVGIVQFLKAFVSDVLMLGMTGIDCGFHAYGWYISTMMIVLIILYPFLRKFGCNIFMLLAGILLIGFIKLNLGTITPWTYCKILNIYVGNLWGLGAIMLGACAVPVAANIKQKLKARKSGAFAGAVWLFLLVFCIIAMNDKTLPTSNTGTPEILGSICIFFLIALSDAMWEGNIGGKWANFLARTCTYLGKISLSLYLVHITTFTLFAQTLGQSYSIGWGVLYVLASIAAAMLITPPSNWLRSKIAKFYS